MFNKMSRSILFVFNYSIMELASNKTPANEQITEIIPLMVYDFLWFHNFFIYREKYFFVAINCENNVRPNRNNVRIAGHTLRSIFSICTTVLMV